MKNTAKAAIAVGALQLGAPQASVAADVWTPSLLPSSVQVVESGGFIVYFASQFSATCGNRVHVYPNQNSVTESGSKAMLSTALASFLAEQPVAVMYDDSTQFCWGRYMTITR